MEKGFTLVELLAVIVILAVISLIATPMILGAIETARKNASVESVNGILDAAEKYTMESMLTGNTQNRFDFPSDTKLNYKGTKPESGTLLINEEEKMSITVSINGYCVRKRFYEQTPTVIEGNCVIEETETDVLISEEEKYKEAILNGADPEIKNNLVPVTIDADGKVTKADVTSEWYNYENKTWANAIVLKDGITLEEAKDTDGSIKEENIKQYYVWIPRYKYQLWNVNSEALYPNGTSGESAINIVFEDKNVVASNGDENGEWLTHPAFISFNTNGIWVGKFETSYDEETFTNSNLFLSVNPNTASAIVGKNITIKPNVRSLTDKNISTFYTMSREVNSSLNSHMMKNSEWGAVAYLTYSLYGKCTSESCEEVYMNNINTGYYGSSAIYSGQWQYGATITGCSADIASTSVSSNQGSCASGYAWNGANNKASTTGNISGIYDMVGGNWEYIMGVLEYGDTGLPVSGPNSLYNSGFNGLYSAVTIDGGTELEKTNGIEFPDSRYYDLYHYNYEMNESSNNIWYDYTTGHLGDTTKEIAISKENSTSGNKTLWYGDGANFITNDIPWFIYGGSFINSSSTGMFNFASARGHASSFNSIRIVLAF